MIAEYLLIGQVVKPQGVQGEVKVKPYTDDPDRYLTLEQVFLKKGDAYAPVEVKEARVREDFAYLRLEGVNDREAAERLRDEMLYVDRAHAVKLPEGRHFICDLIGCRAYDPAGNELGRLKDVLTPCATSVFVFDTPRGEMMMPSIPAVVLEIDTANERIVLDPERLAEVACFED